MPIGFYFQGVAVLMTEPVSINNIKEVLEKEFDIVEIHEVADKWVFSGPSLVISFSPEVNRYVTQDIADRP